ncbi:hypothetical protein BDR03DRAFT_114730 [Suillus americanus]|nr:hypothetical protein BDR03DRAFT_114730 [Suillus americanus]
MRCLLFATSLHLARHPSSAPCFVPLAPSPCVGAHKPGGLASGSFFSKVFEFLPLLKVVLPYICMRAISKDLSWNTSSKIEAKLHRTSTPCKYTAHCGGSRSPK